MGDENDLTVASRLGRIEALLGVLSETQDRFEARLFGEKGDPQGGLIGSHDKRLARLEVWLVRIASGLVVFNFLTGSGPATLGAIFRIIGVAGGVKTP